MKLTKVGVAVCALVGLAIGVGPASAVELRNFDSRNHTVKITSPSLDKEYQFRAMSLSLVICVDKCKFEVAGVGHVFASRDDIVTIESGKVTRTRADGSAVSEPEPVKKSVKKPARRTRARK